MSKQLVTVNSVDINVPVQKKDGGTYQAVRIVYTDSSGRNVVKPIAMSNLAREENTPLAMKLNTLAQNTPKEVVLTTIQNGGFSNITDIQNTSEVDPSELTTTTTGSSPTGKTSSNPFVTKSEGRRFGGRDSGATDKNIRAQVALKAAIDLAVGSGRTSTDEVVANTKVFNSLLTTLTE